MTTETKHMPSEREIETAAQALRTHEQGGRILRAWDVLPNSDKKKWRDKAVVILTAASQSRAPDQSERATTPAARWRAAGEPDPTPQDYERAALPLGHLTDDELANTAYLYTGYIPEDVSNAAKQRMRWLSRRLCETDAALAEARKVIEPFAKLADGCDHFDKHDDDFICVFHRTNGPSIAATSGDCRAARDWLARNPESSNGK